MLVVDNVKNLLVVKLITDNSIFAPKLIRKADFPTQTSLPLFKLVGSQFLLHVTFLGTFTTFLMILSLLRGSVTFTTDFHISHKQQFPT